MPTDANRPPLITRGYVLGLMDTACTISNLARTPDLKNFAAGALALCQDWLKWHGEETDFGEVEFWEPTISEGEDHADDVQPGGPGRRNLSSGGGGD
jgi:hypothetical protein